MIWNGKNKTWENNQDSNQNIQTIDILKYEKKKIILNSKSKVEIAIKKNMNLLQRVNQKIKENESFQSKEHKNRIINKIHQINRMQKQRLKNKSQSDKIIKKLKLQKIYQIQQKNKLYTLLQNQRKTQQKYILQQRKSLRKPINFQQIKNHSINFSKKKAFSQSKPKINFLYTPPKIFTKASQYVKKQYSNNKMRNIKRQNIIKSMIKKRFQYGDEVQKKYHQNYAIKTQRNQTDYSRLQKKIKQQYLQNLKKNKKQKIKFIDGDLITIYQKEIDKIKNSKLSYFQKFQLINNLSKSQIQKIKNGDPQAIQMMTQANLAIAQLFLQQEV